MATVDTPPTPFRAFVACALVTVALLLRRDLRHVTDHVGRRLRFADGATGQVFRETVRTGVPTVDPVLLVVEFRLRLLGDRPWGHALFRVESWANTLLFAGFPGFRWKLWCTDEGAGYRGVYEWDDAGHATTYATTLARLLRALSVPDSVRFHVEPGIRLADVLRDPAVVAPPRAAEPPHADNWWRLDPERIA